MRVQRFDILRLTKKSGRRAGNGGILARRPSHSGHTHAPRDWRSLLLFDETSLASGALDPVGCGARDFLFVSAKDLF